MKPRTAVRLREILARLAWLDLQVLLETYAKAEGASRAAALRGMAGTIEQGAGGAVEQVRGLIAELVATAQAMSGTAAATGGQASKAATAANRTLQTAEMVVGSAEQLSLSVAEITHQVSRSRGVTEAVVKARHQAHLTIGALSKQAADIGEVAKLIADIAGRTNLLALDATIDAVRAGEACKRFAVVAFEVQQLATQTARSTKEITRQISAVQTATGHAAAAVMSIVSTIGGIESIAAPVEQQSASTSEIAGGMGHTATAAKTMSSRTEDVRKAAQEADMQPGAVQQTSSALDEAVSGLRQTVIRVIRTSTEDVNRRADERVAVSLPVQLTRPGCPPCQVRLRDLSVSGASLDMGEDLPEGTEGQLGFEGIGMPFTVRNSRG